MAELFRVRPEKLEQYFANAPCALRRGLDQATAARWVTAIEKTGALCWAEPESDQASQTVPAGRETNHEPAPAGRPPLDHPVAVQAAPAAAPGPQPEETLPRSVSSPSPVILAESIGVTTPSKSPSHTAHKSHDVVPFPKCPKCGRLPLSLEDPFMQTGVCPTCGLIITKYASYFATGQLAVGEKDRHWLAFWQSPAWPAYWRVVSCFCLALWVLPALMCALDLLGVDATSYSPSQMALDGFLLGSGALVFAVISFYCFALFRNSRRIFLIHSACSLGLCVVLGIVGAVISLISRAALAFVRMVGIDRAINPVRAVGLSIAVFLGVVLYLGLVRLPAEKLRLEFLDSAEYAMKVKEALALAGNEFPTGSRADSYRYYKYVYLEPARKVDPNFDRVLRRLLPDFSPAAFARQHQPDVCLLVFNAISFRDELLRDRLITPDTRLRLDQLADEWERSTAGKSLVRFIDTRSPINDHVVRSIPGR